MGEETLCAYVDKCKNGRRRGIEPGEGTSGLVARQLYSYDALRDFGAEVASVLSIVRLSDS